METFYTVIEVQNAGTPAVLTTAFTDLPHAKAKYHAILTAAAVSSVPYHGAFILRSDGILTDNEVYDRRQAE